MYIVNYKLFNLILFSFASSYSLKPLGDVLFKHRIGHIIGSWIKDFDHYYKYKLIHPASLTQKSE